MNSSDDCICVGERGVRNCPVHRGPQVTVRDDSVPESAMQAAELYAGDCGCHRDDTGKWWHAAPCVVIDGLARAMHEYAQSQASALREERDELRVSVRNMTATGRAAERQRIFEATKEAAATRVDQHLLGPPAGGNFEPHRYCCSMSHTIRALTLADVEGGAK